MAPTRMTRRFRGVSLGCAITAALVAGGTVPGGAAEPAAAAPLDALLSTDGIHFSAALAGGLFDDLGMLVPGHSASTDLWIRNPTGVPAALRVSARDVTTSSRALADGVMVSAWDSGTDATRSSVLGALAQCQVLAPSQWLAAGATIRLVLTFTMADLPGSAGQRGSAGLGLMVAMRDAEAGPFPSSACEDDGVLIASKEGPGGSLPTPEADLTGPLLLAGGLLVGAGVFFVVGRRRRGRDGS
jgi:hypothetical protein